MKAPRPPALRLYTCARGARRVAVPFGLKEWSDGAIDVAVLLEAADDDSSSLADVVAQLPDATALPVHATVVVLGEAASSALSWRRWLGDRSVIVPRALRCGALLARGYVDIGAGVDEKKELAWGRVPPR